MSKTIVRCRCGHQVLAREVLRTDLYERSRGRDYVYVKYRCRRCKRLGEAFVAESRWDWSILEPERNEMTDVERDWFLDQGPITASDMLDFHCRLNDTAVDQFQSLKSGSADRERKAPTENAGSVPTRREGDKESASMRVRSAADDKRQDKNKDTRSGDTSTSGH